VYDEDWRVSASCESRSFHPAFREHKCHVVDLRATTTLADRIENAWLYFIMETTSGLREKYTRKGNCA
jgi:hypothetical protein